MENNLIRVFESIIAQETVPTVNARELHAFLEIKSEFRHWVKNRIAAYGFIQGIDFIAGNFLPGSERIDYHITLNMAKELSMVERNEKGRQARHYFIECEKRLKDSRNMSTAVNDPVLSALVQSLIEIDKVKQQQILLESEQKQLKEEQQIIAERQRITESKIEDFANGSEHFSITGYFKCFRHESISNNQANVDGRKLTQIAKNSGFSLGTAPHPVWGTVNTYPKAMLDAFYRGDYN